MKVTPKDYKVISALREDARSTLKDMSRKTNIPISTIYEKLREYNKEIVKRNTSIIDFKLLGFSTCATVFFRIGGNDRQLFRDWLLKSRNTNSVFRVNNGYDYMVEFVFRNMQELEDYLDMLESKFQIKEKQIFYIIEDIKRESFVALI